MKYSIRAIASIASITFIAGVISVNLPSVSIFSFTILKAKIKPKITLTIKSIGDPITDYKLEITGNSIPTTCKSSLHIGCVNIPRKKGAKITYILEGLEDKVDELWEFSKIQLVPPGNNKLKFAEIDNFTDKMIKDFRVKVGDDKRPPNKHGIIDLTGLSDKGREFVLRDKNDFGKFYWYQIKVCKPSGLTEVCRMTDPKIENEGNK